MQDEGRAAALWGSAAGKDDAVAAGVLAHCFANGLGLAPKPDLVFLKRVQKETNLKTNRLSWLPHPSSLFAYHVVPTWQPSLDNNS